ncbi:MAG TPA: hypothetical protein VGC66_01950 [Pyrinomonadaceae bacterium]
MSDEAQTKSTLETIAAKLTGFRRFTEARLSIIESLLENMDMWLDGIESFAHQTRSEVLALRKEFKEFRSQFKEHV